MGRLDGKIALVTGGNGGIGLATAKRFAAEGAVGVQGDVSNLADLDRLYAQIERERGRLDVVFANAGLATLTPFEQATEAQFDHEFDVNVKGLFFTVQKALPLMKDGGSVVLNASIVATKGFENMSVYSATKAAVRSFARTWTTDLKGRDIRVNVVSPGPVVTPGAEALMGGDAAFAENMGAMVPLGRVGDADEIARAVVYLASDDSSFVTGIDHVVDGGLAQV